MEEPGLGPLDRAVELLARLFNAVGLNGTRLQWKWRQRKLRGAEAGLRREIQWRSARGRHKMCPACRALVERSLVTCPECGESLRGVSAPGFGRYLSNLSPGRSATTTLLLAVNGLWFLLMLAASLRSDSRHSAASLQGFDPELLTRFGAGLSRPFRLSTEQVTGGEWWRLITPIFLHGGLLHFVFNSYMLITLGPLVEQIYGAVRYWPIYLACGIAGSAASQLPRVVVTVGASGAIMGLIGLLLVHGLRSGSMLGLAMKRFVLQLAVYMLVLSLLFGNIDHLNHIGGFACGGLLALVVPARPVRSAAESTVWQLLSVAGVLLVLFAFYQVAVFARSAPGH